MKNNLYHLVFPALVVIGCATLDQELKEDCERWRTHNAEGVFTKNLVNSDGDHLEIRCATACVPYKIKEVQESPVKVAGAKLRAYIAEKQGTDPNTTLIDTRLFRNGASHCKDEETPENPILGMYNCAEVCENHDNCTSGYK